MISMDGASRLLNTSLAPSFEVKQHYVNVAGAIPRIILLSLTSSEIRIPYRQIHIGGHDAVTTEAEEDGHCRQPVGG